MKGCSLNGEQPSTIARHIAGNCQFPIHLLQQFFFREKKMKRKKEFKFAERVPSQL